MLVLSRKRCESIRISDDIVVTVLSVQGNRVRLGIEAPKAIPVHRAEVAELILGSASRTDAVMPVATGWFSGNIERLKAKTATTHKTRIPTPYASLESAPRQSRNENRAVRSKTSTRKE